MQSACCIANDGVVRLEAIGPLCAKSGTATELCYAIIQACNTGQNLRNWKRKIFNFSAFCCGIFLAPVKIPMTLISQVFLGKIRPEVPL